MSTIKGYTDSPAKKLVRLNVMEIAQGVLTPSRFQKGRHLGLASREVGDLSVLAGLGVTGQCIMAERDKNTWMDAKVRCHWGDIRNEDIFDVAKAEGKFTHINFDTCAPIRMEMLEQINHLAANHLERGGLLTSWFLAGREHKDITEEVTSMVTLLEQYLTKKMRKLLSKEYPLEVLDDRLPYIARALVLEQSVNTYVHLSNRRHMKLVRIWTYTSTDYDAGKTGSPMVVVQLQECGRNPIGFEQTLLAAIKHDHFIVMGNVKKRLGTKAIELLNDNRDAGLLLNSPKSLAAWKAHATRGSYG